MGIPEHLAEVWRVGDQRTAIEFDDVLLSWRALGQATDDLATLLSAAELGPEAVIGLLGRNRPAPVAGFLAVLAAGKGLLLINAIRPPALIAEEVAGLGLGCLIGSREDLSPAVIDSARQAGTMVIAATVAAGHVEYEVLLARRDGPYRQRQPGTLIEIQTSGTTGAPKRIPVSARTVEASLRDGVRSANGPVAQAQITPKSSPALMFTPLVHTSGTFNTLMAVFEARPIVLFEKFDAEKYRQALVRYRPKFAALPPTAIKMMVDSEATRADFQSVLAVRAGTAPLPVDLQAAFEEKFGVPVLTTYGATEFMGVATSWSLDDHRKFAAEKRGSVGRAAAGVQLRVIHPESGEPLPTGQDGILEAKLDRIDGGKEWVRTTDLARIDQDGFLYILGRADDAIIRGGFKVMAGKVADMIKQFPGIYDATVIGRPDERLGEVPVAVVEFYPGVPAATEDALKSYAKENLTPYEVPVRIFTVEKLPRTVSDKISRPEVKKLVDALLA